MSDPVFVNNAAYTYFTCDRDPTSDEPIVSDIGFPTNWLFFWWNTTTSTLSFCSDGSAIPLVWNIFTVNAPASLINTQRDYSPVSLAFNTNRTPSTTNDTWVLCNVNIVLSILQSSTITAQVNTGSGFITVASASNSGVAITTSSCLSFPVPANSIYKIVSGGTGTNSIISIFELSL